MLKAFFKKNPCDDDGFLLALKKVSCQA